MKMMTAVEINPFEKHSKTKISMSTIFNKLMYCFIITGEKRVNRRKMSEENFNLPEEHKVAHYDPALVARFWNSRNVTKSFWMTFGSQFFRGIYIKLLPVAIVYVVLYYVLNPFVFNKLICSPLSNNTENGFTLALFQSASTCDKENLEKWTGMEKDFTILLTFFIGCFVMITLISYFQQLRTVPQLDQILILFDNFSWANPTKNKMDAIKIRQEIMTKGIRKTIIRYYLLSWAMCLSRTSSKLMENLPDQFAFNRKKLLLKREYDALTCDGKGDIWREKWSAPLLWANKMVNDLDQKETMLVDVKNAVEKTLSTFCQDLQNISYFNDYRMPKSLITLLTLSIYIFMIISVVAGQDLNSVEDNARNDIFKFILDFPIFMLVKYLLLFGWLQVAVDLTVPYGKDRYNF